MSWRRGNRTGPRYIETGAPVYLEQAATLIAIVRQHLGQSRAELEQALQEYVGVGVNYKILRGLIKLLTDRCTFETASSTDPAEIRRALFFKARRCHPVVDSAGAREQVIAEVASELGCAPEAVIEHLYGDLPENQKLIDFEELAPGELLDLYNLAQAQALLYRCVEMRLWVDPQSPSGYRQLFDAIKAYRLIHAVRGAPATGYEIRLNGPMSIFHRSQKYGVQMAVFLPALLLCQGWRMRAEISVKPQGSAFFELTSQQTRLRSHYLSEAPYQRPLVEKLITSWGEQNSPWTLEPSGEVIALGESAFIPDFIARHQSGKQVYLEILGFWTPRYLSERLKELERRQFKNFILIVSDELRGAREQASNLPPNAIVFKTSLDPRTVEAALERIRSEEFN